MSYHFIKERIQFIEEVDSTNNYLKKLVRDNTVSAPFSLYTNFQTQGKGQRSKTWESEPAKNVLASFLVDSIKHIESLPHLNKCMALALVHVLNKLGLNHVSIKWPNDIYVRDHKIAGILIENVIEGKQIKHCILGVGLNINQSKFQSLDATSTKKELGKTLNVLEVLQLLFEQFYALLVKNETQIAQEVNQILYKKGESVTFQLDSGIASYEIRSICSNGNLEVMHEDQQIELEHHRVKWIK